MRQDTPFRRSGRPGANLPGAVGAVFRTLTPAAERDEVLSDLDAEYQHRLATRGAAAARL